MKRRKRKTIDFPFTPWPADVTKSSAWEQLTNAARVAFLHIYERWSLNRKEPVAVSYRAMERIMGRKTYSSAIKQLEALGFIMKTQTGGIFRKRNYFQVVEWWRERDRTGTERKAHADGISIKGSQIDTVKSEEKGPTSSQMPTVDPSGTAGRCAKGH